MSVETTTDRTTALAGVISATGAAVGTDPDKAHALFRATGTGGDGVTARIRVGRHEVLVDEPPALGGLTPPRTPWRTRSSPCCPARS